MDFSGTMKAKVSRCVRTTSCCASEGGWTFMWREFQEKVDASCLIMVLLYIWPTSQFLMRNRIPEGGAALRSVSYDVCPVRVNYSCRQHHIQPAWRPAQCRREGGGETWGGGRGGEDDGDGEKGREMKLEESLKMVTVRKRECKGWLPTRRKKKETLSNSLLVLD